MNPSPEDDRSALARAWGWASSVMVIAAEMVVPGLIGFWIDQQLGTFIIFGMVGFALGVTLAIVHLLRMTRIATKNNLRKRPPQS